MQSQALKSAGLEIMNLHVRKTVTIVLFLLQQVDVVISIHEHRESTLKSSTIIKKVDLNQRHIQVGMKQDEKQNNKKMNKLQYSYIEKKNAMNLDNQKQIQMKTNNKKKGGSSRELQLAPFILTAPVAMVGAFGAFSAYSLAALTFAISMEILIEHVLTEAPTSTPTQKPTTSAHPSDFPTISHAPSISARPVSNNTDPPSISMMPMQSPISKASSAPSLGPSSFFNYFWKTLDFLVDLWDVFVTPVPISEDYVPQPAEPIDWYDPDAVYAYHPSEHMHITYFYYDD